MQVIHLKLGPFGFLPLLICTVVRMTGKSWPWETPFFFFFFKLNSWSEIKNRKKVSYVGEFTSWNLSSIKILPYKVFLIMFQQIKMLCNCQQCWSVLPLVCRRLKFLSNDVVLECQKETRWSWQNMCKPQISKTVCTFMLT